MHVRIMVAPTLLRHKCGAGDDRHFYSAQIRCGAVRRQVGGVGGHDGFMSTICIRDSFRLALSACSLIRIVGTWWFRLCDLCICIPHWDCVRSVPNRTLTVVDTLLDLEFELKEIAVVSSIRNHFEEHLHRIIAFQSFSLSCFVWVWKNKIVF